MTTRQRTTAIAVAIVAASACKKKADDQPAPSAEPAVLTKAKLARPPAKPLTGAELAKRYQGCWDAFEAKKWDDFAGCYADDVTALNLGMPQVAGKAAVLAEHKGWSTAFPDATFAPQLVLVSGRDVFAVRWFHGTHTGVLATPSGDIPATQKPVSLLLMQHVEFDDANRAAHEWFAFDVGTLLAQIGKGAGPGRALLDKGWPGAPELVIAKDDATEHANAAAQRKGYDDFNKRDFAAFDAKIADDVVESFNNEPADTVGKKAVQEENKGFVAAFSDIHVDIDTLWAVGDYTIGFEHVRGTNDGDLGPIKKTGKKLDWTALELNTWKDGKLVRSMPFNNGMEFATQLGLVPTPAK